MKALGRRVGNILLHQETEWQVIKDEPATYADILFHYVAILTVIPPAAAIVGRFIFDREISNNVLQSSFGHLVLTNLLWYFMYVLNVVMVGAIVSAVIAARENRWDGLQGFRIAAYSFTPLFVAGCISVFPRMGWIIDVAVLYSIYLVYNGIKSLNGAGSKRAMGYAIASFICAAVIVGSMNLVEYMLESFVTSRLSW